MKKLTRGLLAAGAVALVAVAIVSGVFYALRSDGARANAPAAAAPAATPVSVAVVEQRDVEIWDEFSGRLEAIERVELRSRVAGAVQSAHFREGALVKQGDLLVTIDPAPYAAEVERAEAQVAAADARVALTKSDYSRGAQLSDQRNITQRELDQRLNAQREAEANARAARAALETAKLNLGYTQVRAPVAGRVGTARDHRRQSRRRRARRAGADNAGLGQSDLCELQRRRARRNPRAQDARRQGRAGRGRKHSGAHEHRGERRHNRGKLQLIDNQVDARSGTVRVRATFDNAEGRFIPGQFARLRMGQPKAEPVLMVNERAIGTDQNKKFVLVVNAENKAEYREVMLGAVVGHVARRQQRAEAGRAHRGERAPARPSGRARRTAAGPHGCASELQAQR